jgi:hypothetical protein
MYYLYKKSLRTVYNKKIYCHPLIYLFLDPIVIIKVYILIEKKTRIFGINN